MRPNPNRLAAVAFAAALAVAGCHKRIPVSALPPPLAPPPPAVSAPVPTPAPPPAFPSPAAIALDQADRAFVAGSYADAARSYENFLRLNPSGNQRDGALFHLGLSYALPPAPAADWQKAAAAFKQLADEYPNSPYKPPANLILSLHSELDQATTGSKQRDQRIKQLTTELDRLKKIDADRLKRP
jgi:TolA-binding protein